VYQHGTTLSGHQSSHAVTDQDNVGRVTFCHESGNHLGHVGTLRVEETGMQGTSLFQKVNGIDIVDKVE
jgi:hypothetical protein